MFKYVILLSIWQSYFSSITTTMDICRVFLELCMMKRSLQRSWNITKKKWSTVQKMFLRTSEKCFKIVSKRNMREFIFTFQVEFQHYDYTVYLNAIAVLVTFSSSNIKLKLYQVMGKTMSEFWLGKTRRVRMMLWRLRLQQGSVFWGLGRPPIQLAFTKSRWSSTRWMPRRSRWPWTAAGLSAGELSPMWQT